MTRHFNPCTTFGPNLTMLAWGDSLHPAWKPPTLISFDSFEAAVAHFAHRAADSELRELANLEEIRQAKLKPLSRRKTRQALEYAR